MFVDDNVCVAIHRLIAEVVACAIGSAYYCIRDPETMLDEQDPFWWPKSSTP